MQTEKSFSPKMQKYVAIYTELHICQDHTSQITHNIQEAEMCVKQILLV